MKKCKELTLTGMIQHFLPYNFRALVLLCGVFGRHEDTIISDTFKGLEQSLTTEPTVFPAKVNQYI